MGILARLEEARYRVERARWIDTSLRTSVAIDYPRLGQMLGGRLLSLMRGGIERALFDALPSSVDVLFGSTVDSIADLGMCVEVAVGSGGHERADLLVGADGIHSRVRSLAFGDERLLLRELGYHTAAFVFEDATLHESLKNEFVRATLARRFRSSRGRARRSRWPPAWRSPRKPPRARPLKRHSPGTRRGGASRSRAARRRAAVSRSGSCPRAAFGSPSGTSACGRFNGAGSIAPCARCSSPAWRAKTMLAPLNVNPPRS